MKYDARLKNFEKLKEARCVLHRKQCYVSVCDTVGVEHPGG